jgi:hypothetical protein
MANMRVGESGKRLRFATSFNMSSGTSFNFDFIKGDESASSVTPTLETGSVTMDLDGVSTIVAANESVFYDMLTTDLSANSDGEWSVDLTYTNTGPTPDDIFKAKTTFTVDP